MKNLRILFQAATDGDCQAVEAKVDALPENALAEILLIVRETGPISARRAARTIWQLWKLYPPSPCALLPSAASEPQRSSSAPLHSGHVSLAV
jgi:hypothetical protein